MFTFVRHHFTSLKVHLDAAGHADLVDVVAQLVAAVLPAAEAQTLVEGLSGVAAVGQALLLGVQQRVDEQMDRALVGTFDKLVHICRTQSTEPVKLPHFQRKCLPRVAFMALSLSSVMLR